MGKGISTSRAALKNDQEVAQRNRKILGESLLNVTPGVLYIHDRVQGHSVFANQGLGRILGYCEPEITDLGDDIFAALLHPDDLANYHEQIQPKHEGMGDEERLVSCWRMRDRNGAWRWLESTEVVCQRDPDGHPSRIMGLAVDVTERKRAEAALEDAKEILHEFILHSPIHAYIKEVEPSESRVLFASESFRDMIGIPGREMTGKTMQELFPPDFARKITEDDWNVASKGEELRIEESLGDRSYTTIKFPIRRGGRTLLAGYTIDMTERKLVEDRLRESEYFFKESQRASRTGSYRLNIRTGKWDFSEVLGQIFGIDDSFRPDIKDWLSLVHPDDRPMMIQHYTEDVVGKHKRFNKEYRIVRPSDGAVRWVHGLGELELDTEGEPTHMIGTVRDITERHDSEEALYLSEERLKLATRAANIGIWDWDIEHDKLVWDESMYAIYGIGWEEFWGALQAWSKGIHPEDRARTEVEVEAAIRGECEYAPEFRIVRPSGEIRHIKAVARTIRNQGGQAIRMIGVNIDITERKLGEQELEQHREHLEELVMERTSQLETANRELDSFCHSVSHDLRAPLRYLDGFVGLLLASCGEELSEEGRRYTSIIASSARKMGQLIDDLLAFSRTSRQEMTSAPVDMDKTLRETLQPMQEANAGRDIDWKIGRMPEVRGDKGLLRQVWANLLGNAVKYTGKREKACIEVGFSQQGRELVFYVKDDGVGFDPRYADKLFGVFQRLHRPEDFEGTGIGLATVQRIVARHGGRIWAQSVPEEGATFFFSLPMPAEVDHA